MGSEYIGKEELEFLFLVEVSAACQDGESFCELRLWDFADKNFH